MEWQDLRILLAVARTGSVVAAGRELAVAHTTVSRRLAALELHRPALFTRTPGGLVPTPEGEALLERARAVEDAMQALDRRMSSLAGRLEGTVRLATNLPWGELLIPRLGRLRERAPGVTLHVQISNALVDLARHEADVAVRAIPPGQAPAWSNVVARKLATVGFALFGGERYFARRGEPPGPIADPHRHRRGHRRAHRLRGARGRRRAMSGAMSCAVTRAMSPGDDRFGQLVGHSSAMRRVIGQLEAVAASDATVLLLGETGTGKEVAAEALHHESPRARGPFVIVDCGAIPASASCVTSSIARSRWGHGQRPR
jgi:DNA-binding transcriptional LysR family regulator